MTVALPPKEDNQAKAAWLLELTREINRLETNISALEERVKELEDDKNTSS